MRGSGYVVLHVAGELDISTAPLLAERLAAELDSDDLVVDLSEVGFMDCSGLNVLLDAVRRRDGRRIWVTPGPRQVQRLFALTAAAEQLPPVPCAATAAA